MRNLRVGAHAIFVFFASILPNYISKSIKKYKKMCQLFLGLDSVPANPQVWALEVSILSYPYGVKKVDTKKAVNLL